MTPEEVAATFDPVGVNQWSAHFQCIEESARFAIALAQAGIPFRFVYGDSEEFGIGHVAVLVEGRVYDWTARQFWPDAPLPRVTSEAEFERDFEPNPNIPYAEILEWIEDGPLGADPNLMLLLHNA